MAPAERKRRPAAPAERRPSRSEAKNEAARAALKPLGEGERPTAVTVAAVLAALLALVNALFFVTGREIQGEEPTVGVLAYSGLMLIAAWGMWRKSYWAVLGMQALLAIVIIGFSILLIRASNALGVIVAVGVIAGAGTLFWFLVKALARIQMPERR